MIEDLAAYLATSDGRVVGFVIMSALIRWFAESDLGRTKLW